MTDNRVVSDQMIRTLDKMVRVVLRKRNLSWMVSQLGGAETAIPEVLSEVYYKLLTSRNFRENLERLIVSDPECKDALARYLYLVLRRVLIDLLRGTRPPSARVRVRVPSSVLALGIWAVWVFDRLVCHGESEDRSRERLREILSTEAGATRAFEKVAQAHRGPLGLGSKTMAPQEIAQRMESLLRDALEQAKALADAAALEDFVERVWDLCDRDGAFETARVDGGEAVNRLQDDRDHRGHAIRADHSLPALTVMLYIQHMLVFLAVRGTSRPLAGLASAILKAIAPDIRPTEIVLMLARAVHRELGMPNVNAVQKSAEAAGIKGTASYEFGKKEDAKMRALMARLFVAIEDHPSLLEELDQRGFFDEHDRLDRGKANAALLQLVEPPEASRIRVAVRALFGSFQDTGTRDVDRRLERNDITLDIEAVRTDVHAFVGDQSVAPCGQVHE